MATRIIFITGTDTGVGKTLLTALLLCHLRAQGGSALGLKPFCSGGRGDAELLCQLQDGDLTLDEINPFHFREPIAPLVSSRKHKRPVPLDLVVGHINSIALRLSSLPESPRSRFRTKNSKVKSQNYLLIEGSGGLLVPLGEGYTVCDVIARVACDVLVVSRNQLGTINHTLLTLKALANPTPPAAVRSPHSSDFSLQPSAFSLSARVVLMDPAAPDASSRTNPAILAELIDPIPLVRLAFLGSPCASISELRKAADKSRKTLARLV